MVRILAVITKEQGEVIEYTVLDRAAYATADALLDAVRDESARLSKRHGLPHPDRELFEGGARSVEGFFRMFPNLKLTARSLRTPHPARA